MPVFESAFADTPGPWRQRFEFFHAYGLPSSSPQARAAFKELPFGTRMRLNSNFLAFLFGPFYFFAKGMWRKGVSLLVAAIAVGVVMTVLDVPDGIDRGVAAGFGAAAMVTANYAYYLHVVQHSRSWNLFEGFSRRAARAN
ncbi:DUF2628 domain-containing protein [Mycobacterium talmoniae]|uniref:DUF2628 domain-containing protein n=1 Tax=Mycobacterium talmoniae TaxID=1858794 RepID=A0A1S1NJD7_9MYCO|nr:hypothetical protein BKN37_17690 [Mycobacterium talmoniae]